MEIMLKPAEELFTTNFNEYPIDYGQLSNFLLESYGNKDYPLLIKNLTNNQAAFIQMLQDVHAGIKDKTLKGRITRIVRRLEKQEGYETSSTDDQ